MTLDRYFARRTVQDPAIRLQNVTPSDTVDFAEAPKSIYVGTGGDINVLALHDSQSVLFKDYQGWLPVRVKRVLETGTTATDIVAAY